MDIKASQKKIVKFWGHLTFKVGIKTIFMDKIVVEDKMLRYLKVFTVYIHSVSSLFLNQDVTREQYLTTTRAQEVVKGFLQKIYI